MIKFIEHDKTAEGVIIYARVDEDGLIRFTCTEDNSDYQAYLASLDEQQAALKAK